MCNAFASGCRTNNAKLYYATSWMRKHLVFGEQSSKDCIVCERNTGLGQGVMCKFYAHSRAKTTPLLFMPVLWPRANVYNVVHSTSPKPLPRDARAKGFPKTMAQPRSIPGMKALPCFRQEPAERIGSYREETES